jgi:hypothetical protein
MECEKLFEKGIVMPTIRWLERGFLRGGPSNSPLFKSLYYIKRAFEGF